MGHDDGFVRSGDTHYPNNGSVATIGRSLHEARESAVRSSGGIPALGQVARRILRGADGRLSEAASEDPTELETSVCSLSI